METPVSLATICGGALEAEFQRIYPALVSQLREGNKASLAIGIEFKKVPDTATMVAATFSVTPKLPAKKKSGLCMITGDGKLKTEAPVEKANVVALFKEGGQANE